MNATKGDIDEARTIITNQLHQAVRIVNDLLDLNRVERGKIDFRPVHIDLVAVVRQAVETSRACLAAANHELRIDVPCEPIWSNGDPARISQVVTNLLNNACKYTPPGGRIQLTLRRQDGQAMIRIRDNGLGIRPEMLPRLFDMFAQSDDARAHSQGGMGIGLALVRRLVELHQGTVEALSAGPGQGSEFIVWLPLAASLKASVGSIDISEHLRPPLATNGAR